MLTRRLSEARRSHELGLHLMSMNMRSGPQHRHTILEYTPMATERDYRNWLSRLRGLPTLLQQYIELLEEGITADRVQARAIMERVPAQLDKVITEQPEDSPFYRPFQAIPDSIPAATASELREQANAVIANQVTPAYREFRDFFVSTYLPASREQPGIGSLPGGEEIYRFLAESYTTTDLTPEQIHETGKREVARILGEMEEVRKAVGFDGDLQAFNEFLRTDPQFYYDSPEALLEGYQAVSKRLDPELVKLFGKLPRMPYGVKPIPAETAPDTTTAYYMGPAANGTRAGYYYVNLYRPEVRPKYEMEVLSVHEAVPGHHLQIALAQELEGLPEFRRASRVTAFVEGWGLYSERLGYQMGLYQDPYSRYGQLTYDMWRAVRLVVDTGLHYFGWSRQEAIDYFKANAGKTEADIINEIDRYIGWPGQALAYKIGQLKILELRASAEQALGEDFDIRAFHDELLGAGAIPLDALEARMNAWMARQG
jgi:prolyl oligopeptidase